MAIKLTDQKARHQILTDLDRNLLVQAGAATDLAGPSCAAAYAGDLKIGATEYGSLHLNSICKVL